MNCDKAVEIMMRDIRTSVPDLPAPLEHILESRLSLGWKAGYEHRGKQLAYARWNRRQYVIQQFNRDDELIGEYTTQQDAIRYGDICRTSLFYALTGRRTVKGHTWKRKFTQN